MSDLNKGWEKAGWLHKYLIAGDEIFGVGRLKWWLDGMWENKIPNGEIPQIAFDSGISNSIRKGLPLIPKTNKKDTGPVLSAQGARKHIEDLVSDMGGGWDAMLYFIRWLHFGLGLTSKKLEQPGYQYEQQESWGDLLCRKFELGRLQAADADVLGDMLAERHGSGWNPHQFYPTPQTICYLMSEMIMPDGFKIEGKDSRLTSVNDCCVGTGRMLLEASNKSLNLWAMDIDRTMVEVCSINMALYAPWGVYLTPTIRELMGKGNTHQRDVSAITTMNEQRKEQGHKDAFPKDKEIKFDKHGQGDLFSLVN